MVTVLIIWSSCTIGIADTRIFGIPGTILGRTLLQVGPGSQPGVVTTLLPKTSVQVLCKTASVVVVDDPWWLKVHVWDSGLEGFVADFWVQCRHAGYCQVPFCTL